MSHLYGLESVESIFGIECDRILQEHPGLSKVPDGDGDGDGVGHSICLQVDVLLAVRPEQVGSQQGEPAGANHGMKRGWLCVTNQIH